jgi:di/tricarboxylate transporter
VLVLVILVATFSGLPLSLAALAGAVALVLAGCVRAREAHAVIDWGVVVLIGGMLALGRAFDEHELGRAVAARVVGLAAHPVLAVALLSTAAAVLAQTTTSVGTAVILAPVALSLAEALGVSDRPLLMAVLAGANCAFLSPVANAANAMVMGPGGYRFRDFLRAGLPLTALVLALTCVAVPFFFPFDAAR